jgi:predicted metal-dependent hydrolase
MSVTILNLNSKKSLLQYGDEQIEYSLISSKNDAWRVIIKVYPDCHVVVQAPEKATEDEVISAIKKRSRWIHNQIIFFRSQLEYITPRQYVSGETHYYLGRQHLLKVIASSAKDKQVKLLRGKLEVIILNKQNKVHVKQLLQAWYKEKALEVFSRRLDAMLEQTLWVSERPSIRIQSMQTQWGSCSPHGRLTLNPHLVKAPRECIDYVILHELCHISEHNHSKRFYRLLKQVMPNWQKVKERLDSMAAVILNGS